MPRRGRSLPPGIFLLLPLFIISFAVLELRRPSEGATRAQSAVSDAADAQRKAVEHASNLAVAVDATISTGNRSTSEFDVRMLIPACAKEGGKAQSFVLLFMGHSGSTALISALQQHANVLIAGFEPLDHGDMASDTPQALEYARAFFAAGKRSGRVAGFKLRPRHILQNPQAWARLFREHRTRIVWNYRANM